MYVNENIPTTFKYIAEIHDNYFVLVDRSTLESGTNYNAYIQFSNPSSDYLYITNYRIKTGDSYSLEYNYNNLSDHLESADVFYSLQTIDISDMISSDFWHRADYNNIFGVGLMITFLCVFIVNLCSTLVKRGGLFFGQ